MLPESQGKKRTFIIAVTTQSNNGLTSFYEMCPEATRFIINAVHVKDKRPKPPYHFFDLNDCCIVCGRTQIEMTKNLSKKMSQYAQGLKD